MKKKEINKTKIKKWQNIPQKMGTQFTGRQ
jgi:hypothetical protein